MRLEYDWFRRGGVEGHGWPESSPHGCACGVPLCGIGRIPREPISLSRNGTQSSRRGRELLGFLH